MTHNQTQPGSSQNQPLGYRTLSLDIVEGVAVTQSQVSIPEVGRSKGKPWIQVWFACTGQYQRVFRNADGSAYMARCTTCGKTMRFAVGSGGTNQRMFTVTC